MEIREMDWNTRKQGSRGRHGSAPYARVSDSFERNRKSDLD
jgi:hypothetical protein